MVKSTKLIASLTSYSHRVLDVDKVIKSLKSQTYELDKILLWLDEDEYSFQTLPDQLKSLIDSKFEVHFCQNLKSYKKLIPTLKLYSNDNIITFDDDIIISNNVVKDLFDAHCESPDAIIALRGRFINLDQKGNFLNYHKWQVVNNNVKLFSKFGIIPIGFGGVLYPASSLHKEVLNETLFMDIADNADDIWFKCLAMLNGTPTVLLPRHCSSGYQVIDKSQEIGLYLTENLDNRNVEVLLSIIKHFTELDAIFKGKRFSQVCLESSELAKLISEPNLFVDRNEAADFFRTNALKIEKNHLPVAFALMKLAKKYRPNGQVIIKKLQEYKNKLGA